jgi:predicted nucleic acid-binding protein
VRRYVLDANAVLIFLAGSPGARRVKALFVEANRAQSPLLMSAVNWGEVVYSLWKQSGETEVQRLNKEVSHLPLVILPVDRERATYAAELKARHDLAYADSFASALTLELSATLVTADPEFTKVGKRLKLLSLPRHGA